MQHSVTSSVCSSSGVLSSSRTRITAPFRDHHGEPLGKPTISRHFLDYNGTSDCSDKKSISSWSTETSDLPFSLIKTLSNTEKSRQRSKSTRGNIELKSNQEDGDEIRSENQFSQDIRLSKPGLSRKSNDDMPDRLQPRWTKSVLYDTVNQKQYRGEPKKRSDPVRLYQQYQAYWKTHEIPGQNPHRELRWNIRSLLMEKDYEVPLNSRRRRSVTPEKFLDGKDDLIWSRPDSYDLPGTVSDRSSEAYWSGDDGLDDWTPPPPPSPRWVAPRKLHSLVLRSPEKD